jgi:hypothetical protein
MGAKCLLAPEGACRNATIIARSEFSGCVAAFMRSVTQGVSFYPAWGGRRIYRRLSSGLVSVYDNTTGGASARSYTCFVKVSPTPVGIGI